MTASASVLANLHYKRHRYPAEIIAHAVWPYFRFPLSLRHVEELLDERGIDVSFQTVSEGSVANPAADLAAVDDDALWSAVARECLRKKRLAASKSRLSLNKNSIVSLTLSIARLCRLKRSRS